MPSFEQPRHDERPRTPDTATTTSRELRDQGAQAELREKDAQRTSGALFELRERLRPATVPPTVEAGKYAPIRGQHPDEMPEDRDVTSA